MDDQHIPMLAMIALIAFVLASFVFSTELDTPDDFESGFIKLLIIVMVVLAIAFPTLLILKVI